MLSIIKNKNYSLVIAVLIFLFLGCSSNKKGDSVVVVDNNKKIMVNVKGSNITKILMPISDPIYSGSLDFFKIPETIKKNNKKKSKVKKDNLLEVPFIYIASNFDEKNGLWLLKSDNKNILVVDTFVNKALNNNDNVDSVKQINDFEFAINNHISLLNDFWSIEGFQLIDSGQNNNLKSTTIDYDNLFLMWSDDVIKIINKLEPNITTFTNWKKTLKEGSDIIPNWQRYRSDVYLINERYIIFRFKKQNVDKDINKLDKRKVAKIMEKSKFVDDDYALNKLYGLKKIYFGLGQDVDYKYRLGYYYNSNIKDLQPIIDANFNLDDLAFNIESINSEDVCNQFKFVSKNLNDKSYKINLLFKVNYNIDQKSQFKSGVKKVKQKNKTKQKNIAKKSDKNDKKQINFVIGEIDLFSNLNKQKAAENKNTKPKKLEFNVTAGSTVLYKSGNKNNFININKTSEEEKENIEDTKDIKDAESLKRECFTIPVSLNLSFVKENKSLITLVLPDKKSNKIIKELNKMKRINDFEKDLVRFVYIQLKNNL